MIGILQPGHQQIGRILGQGRQRHPQPGAACGEVVVKLGIPQIKHIQIIRNAKLTGGFVLKYIPDGVRTKSAYGDGCASLDQPGQLFGGISREILKLFVFVRLHD